MLPTTTKDHIYIYAREDQKKQYKYILYTAYKMVNNTLLITDLFVLLIDNHLKHQSIV